MTGMTAKTHSQLLHVLNISFVIAFVFGFAWLSLDQVRKFLSGKTSVTTAFKEVDAYELPTIIFCPESPYLNFTESYGFDENDFKVRAKRPQVTFLGEMTWGVTLVNITNNTFPLYSVYNGECLVFELPRKMKHRKFLSFIVTGSYDIYLSKRKEEVLVIEQTFTPISTGFVSIESKKGTHYMIELMEKRYKYRESCINFDEDTHRIDCLLDQLAEKVKKDPNIDCIPIHYYSYMKDRLELPLCNKTQKFLGHNMLHTSGAFLADPVLSEVCPFSCEKTLLSQRAVKAYYDNPFKAQLGEDSYYIFFIFPMSVVEYHEEYLVFDAPGIIASVGGGLGLFLGFSCLSSAKYLTDFISRKM